MTSLFRNWFSLTLPPQGNIISDIWPKVLLLGGVGLMVSGLAQWGIPIAIAVPGYIVELILVLLLFFGVNVAYHRFLDGQQYWGTLINTVRNLTRQVWLAVEDKEAKDRQRKIEAVQWLAAFMVTTKLYLRHQPLHTTRDLPDDIKQFLSGEQYQILMKSQNPPLEIAFWLGDYLQLQYQRERLNLSQLSALNAQLDQLVAVVGNSDRLVNSSFTNSYLVYLRCLLLLYCILLPLQMVAVAGWATAPIVMVIGSILLGIEAISRVLEHPFYPHPQALPLDAHSKLVIDEIQTLTARPPRSANQTSIKMTIVPE